MTAETRKEKRGKRKEKERKGAVGRRELCVFLFSYSERT
jgi:hypothetical protein